MGEGDGGQVEWFDDLVEAIRRVHDQLLQVGGGVPGEHTASLLSACARPYHTFDGEYLYSTTYERAAALFHGIICDHPFADGNKRTGTIAAILLMAAEDTSLLPDFRDQGHLRVVLLGDVALDTAKGLVTVQQAAEWLQRIFQH